MGPRLAATDDFPAPTIPPGDDAMAWTTDSPSSMNQRVISIEYRFLSAVRGHSASVRINGRRRTSPRRAGWWLTARASAKRFARRSVSARFTGWRQRPSRHRERGPRLVACGAVRFPAFQHRGYPYPTVRLQGLDPEARYRLTALQGAAEEHTPAVASGVLYWMNAGINLRLLGDFQAALAFEGELAASRVSGRTRVLDGARGRRISRHENGAVLS